MRLTNPRIAALSDDQMDADQKAILAPMAATGRVLNVFRTMVHAPDSARSFLPWGAYILSRRNALPPRQREIVILRTGFLCKSGYEWAQHKEIGLRDGLTEAEIEAVKTGVDAATWSAPDAVLIRAADELHADHFITDATWAALKAHFNEKQCMDVVYTVGQYTQVSMILNSFGVQLDAGQTLDPDLKGF
jgi:alkylhydroperoxidase family enzyme